MKKDRPGFTLSVLAKAEDRDRLSELLLDETTTLGLRMYRAERRVLDRRWEAVETPYGVVRVKIASENGRVRNFAPEYEDCRQLARERKVPLKDVIQQANYAYLRLSEKR
jgi:uncharacterized protein (DUF111 family)